MKFKKIMSAMAVALTVAVGTLTFGQGVYAAEISNNATVVQNKQASIGPNTTITKDNLSDVLKYVGLNKSDFIPADNTNSNIKTLETVGELQTAINQAKKSSKVTVINKTIKPLKITNKSNNTSTTSTNKTTTASYRSSYGGSLALSTDAPIADAFTLTRSCSGQYEDTRWVGVSNPSVSVSTDSSVFTYKIASGANLSATWNPSLITMNSYVTVNKYVAVKFGFTCVGYQGVQGTDYYYSRDYVDSMN